MHVEVQPYLLFGNIADLFPFHCAEQRAYSLLVVRSFEGDGDDEHYVHDSTCNVNERFWWWYIMCVCAVHAHNTVRQEVATKRYWPRMILFVGLRLSLHRVILSIRLHMEICCDVLLDLCCIDAILHYILTECYSTVQRWVRKARSLRSPTTAQYNSRHKFITDGENCIFLFGNAM